MKRTPHTAQYISAIAVLCMTAFLAGCGGNDDAALRKAVRTGALDRAEELLSEGADVDATDKDDWGALHEAARYGHSRIVALLLKNGADVDARTFSGLTALHLAVFNSNEEVVSVLLANGADPKAEDERGWTPLYWAGAIGHKPTSRALAKPNLDADEGGKRD